MLSQINLDVATNANDLKLDCASLKRDVKKKRNASLKYELKSEIARDAEELKTDMKTAINISHEKVVNRVEACELRVDELTN